MLAVIGTGFVPAAASTDSESLLAMTTVDGKQTLFRVEAGTLARLESPVLQIPGSVGGRLRSPDRSVVVLADNQKPVLTFVNVDSMKVGATLQVAKVGTVDLAAWPAQKRLLAFAYGPLRTDLLVIDPDAAKVIARRPVGGSGWPRVSLATGLVYLATPAKAIGRARLVVIDLDGNSRSVVLDRIRAGTKWRKVRGVQIANVRQPGLAADPTGRTAYVVDAGGLVAEVDLATLAVTYHSLDAAGTRRLARAQKSVNGPIRSATWVGDGHLAVSGVDAKMTVTGGTGHESWTPIGLSIVDVANWRSRLLDPAAGGFISADGTLLVTRQQSFTAYDLEGRTRYTVSLDAPLLYVQAIRGYVYAWGEHVTTIVALSSGDIVARIPTPKLWLLADS
jgi:hypothetical protein